MCLHDDTVYPSKAACRERRRGDAGWWMTERSAESGWQHASTGDGGKPSDVSPRLCPAQLWTLRREQQQDSPNTTTFMKQRNRRR